MVDVDFSPRPRCRRSPWWREHMESFAIVNATVILPDQIVEGGAVAVRDGAIAEVAPSVAGLAEQPAHQIDADGAYLMPGLVDLHNDGYEYELNPRPGANLPPALAFSTNAGGRLAPG